MHGTCRQKAACGRQCTLAADGNHQWHICREPDCAFCHDRDWTKPVQAPVEREAVYRGDQDDDPLAGHRGGLMDWITSALALFGLVGVWVAGWWG